MAGVLRLPTRSIGLKFLLVVALALAMTIPTLFVYGVMRDRLGRFESVREEISRYEGGAQTILGPVLLVPYEKQIETTSSDNKVQVSTMRGEAVAFAETGAAKTALTGETKKRGIYTIPTFKSDTALSAHFDIGESKAALAALDPAARYDWSKARIVMGVSNTVGVLKDIALALPGGQSRQLKPITFSPAASPTDYQGDTRPGGFSLVAAPVGDVIGAGGTFDVSSALQLSGAERFSIAAFAKDTEAAMTGKWSDPSFEGGFLPTQKKIEAGQFSAEWAAPLARRGIPEVAASIGALSQTAAQDFAVRLVSPTNIYTGMDRALKYAMMFIGLVFLAYFMFEIVSGLRAHPAQYIMVGLAQAIFYLLLLAFAERIGFDAAFLIAAAATVTLISLYVGVVFKKLVYTAAAFLVFIAVYALMYVLMQAEDYALLVGAITSFAALAALMFLTRNVAWYGASERADASAPG
ncbi:MAG TPA: cell envelope integrity protein CreD [Caulobacterales bacterium]|nr:cell envelope integrity protein CreD [Caulobacterales bacterium]